MQDAQMLLRVQECDLEAMRLRKRIESMSQIEQVNACRDRRKQIKAKRLQIAQVLGQVKDRLEDLQAEAQRVNDKMAELQHTLDHNADFRVTSAAMRDYEGQAKRKQSIAVEEDQALERQAELEEKLSVVDGLAHEVDAKEAALTEELRREGGVLKRQLEEATAERTRILGQVDPALVARYERFRGEKKGVGIGRLEGRMCSACRAQLMDGQYRKLMSGPDLGQCPNCQRLIYTGDDSQGGRS